MSDLTFNGGQNAAFFGNQQFTVRNFTINNANNAINMAWDWGLSPVHGYVALAKIKQAGHSNP